MANAMKLANVDSSASIDIYSGELTGEFGFVVEEWTTQAAPEAEAAGTAELDDYELALPHEPVIETLTLVADVSGDSGLNNDDIRALVVSLQDMRRKAMEWRNDPLRAESIWWHWNIDGEADKRALVHRLEFSLREGFFSMLQGQSIVVDLTIIRHPYYEPVTSPTTTNTASIADFTATMSLAAAGDTNGRIASFDILASAVVAGDLYEIEAWAGIKPTGDGVAGFINIWELEDGTVGTDASAGAVSGASGSDAVTVTFSTDESLVERVSILLGDVAASNISHNRGNFLWLLRYKAEGSGVGYHIRLVQRYQLDAGKQVISEIYVPGEATAQWHVVPLGVASIPFGMGREGLPTSDIALEWSGFSIEAARIDGSGGDDLILDCLAPIPMTHHLHIQNLNGGGVNEYGLIKTFEDDSVMGYSALAKTTRFLHPSPPAPVNWNVPPEGGLLVVAVTGQVREAGIQSVTTDTIPRWALFNGA